MPGAGARRFVDLCVFLHASDKVSDDFENMPLNLSLPPTSAVGFDGHQKSLQRIANAQKMGLPVKVPENPLRFYMWCVGKKSGTNEWTAAEVGNNLPSTMRRAPAPGIPSSVFSILTYSVTDMPTNWRISAFGMPVMVTPSSE
jgi:hypothetical protein